MTAKEIDPKAGGGCTITIGQMVRSFLLKLDWYDSLFPRIPVPIQKEINGKLQERNLCDDRKRKADEGFGEAERYSKMMRDKERYIKIQYGTNGVVYYWERMC